MAEDWKVAHDAEGQNFVRLAGTDEWRPVSPDDLARLKEGGAEAFARSAINSAGQAVTGAGALAGVPGARERFDTLQRRQEFRSEGSPVAGFAGSLAPDVAIGAVTGGAGSLARRVGTTAAIEGGLGAARNPDAPLRGAAIQGGFGALGGLGGAALARGGISAGRFSGNARADKILGEIDAGTGGEISRATGRAGVRSMEDAAEISGARGVAGPGSMMGNTTGEMSQAGTAGFRARVAGIFEGDPPPPEILQRADQLGIKLTPADRKGSVAQKNLESSLQANPTAQAVFDQAILKPNQETLNRLYNRATGFGDDVTVDQGEIINKIERGYQDVTAEIGRVDLTNAVSGDAILRDIKVPRNRAQVEGVIENLPTGNVSGAETMELLSALRKEASTEFNAGRETIGEGIERVAEQIEDRMLASADPAVADRLRELRSNWRMAMLGERGKAITPEGDISFASMANNLSNSKFTAKDYRRGRSFGNKASNDFTEGVQILSRFRERIGNSGTATRSADWLDYKTYLGAPVAHGYLKGGVGGAAAGGAVPAAGLGAGGAAVFGD